MATHDLCSLADVKAADTGLWNEATSLDALITDLITQASEALMAWAGRRYAPADASDVARLVEVGGFYRGGVVPVHDLVAAPTTVRILDQDAATVVAEIAAGGWVALPVTRDPDVDPVTAVRVFATTLRPTDLLEVTGRWGWPVVPERARRACVVTVMQWLRDARAITRQSPDQFEPGSPPQRALPIAAMDLLRHDRTPVMA